MKNSQFQLRGELRLKNERLVRSREETGMNQKEFSAMVKIPYVIYNGYENLRDYPIPKHKQILANFCGCTEEELFPEELKKIAEGEEPRKIVHSIIVEPSRLLGSVRKQALLVKDNSSPENELFIKERYETVCKYLDNSLTRRQRKVLEMTFGLKGENLKTMDEIADYMGTTKDRVRGIRDQALRILREKYGDQNNLGVFFDED